VPEPGCHSRRSSRFALAADMVSVSIPIMELIDNLAMILVPRAMEAA
jgi:hypothetical protein